MLFGGNSTVQTYIAFVVVSESSCWVSPALLQEHIPQAEEGAFELAPIHNQINEAML
jgi:hypothetical protein